MALYTKIKKALKEIVPAALALGVALSLVLTAFFWRGAFDGIDEKLLNWAMVKRKAIRTIPYLVTIDIDDIALNRVGRWPWPWKIHADLVDFCTLNGAKSIAFVNIDLSKRGLNTFGGAALDNFKKRMSTLLEGKDYDGLRLALPDSGETLAESFKRNTNAYITVDFKIPDDQDNKKPSLFSIRSAALGLTGKEKDKLALFERQNGIEGEPKKFPTATGLTIPGMEILESVRRAGFNSILIDNDGIVRKYPLMAYYPDKLFPSLPLEIAMGAINATESVIFPGKSITLKGESRDLIIPVDKDGQIFVNWAGPYEGTFMHIPFNLAALFMASDKAKEEAGKYDLLKLGNASTAVMAKLVNAVELAGYVTPQQAREVASRIFIAAFMEALVNMSDYSDNEVFSLLGGDSGNPVFVDILKQIRFNNKILDIYKKTGQIPSFEEALKQLQDVHPPLGEDGTGAVSRIRGASGGVSNPSQSGAQTPSKNGKEPIEPKDSILSYTYDIMSYHIGKGTIDFVHPLYFENATVPYKGKMITITPLFFKDKIVLYGLTATGLTAQHPTPFSRRHPMLDLVPNVLNTILTGQFLVLAPPWFKYVSVYAFVLFVLTSVLAFNPARGGAVALALVVAYTSTSWIAMVRSGYLFPIAEFWAAMVAAYFTGVLYRYVKERKERTKVRGMFSTMVSAEVLRIIETNPNKLSLGGEKREATMFSSDVSGFTTISEGVTSRELANILNIYLTPMSNIIMSYNGYIDKYEGDAIKADFGVPLSDSDQCWKACYAALCQQEELKVIQRMLFIKYGVKITARMGINTGIVSAGNMGSVNRMQYTVIGDAATVAEELEPANKIFDTWIMIGEPTYQKAKDHIYVRFLGELALGHEEHALKVYEVLGWKTEAFLNYWSSRPIPELLLEQFRKMQPEKILAYEYYFQKKELPESEMLNYFKQTFSELSSLSVEYIKLLDIALILETGNNLTELIHNFMSFKHIYNEIELSQTVLDEVDSLSAKIDSETRPWNRKLLQWREGLMACTPYLPGMRGKINPADYDIFINKADIIEKSIERLYKRITTPEETDRVGIELAEHLISTLSGKDFSSANKDTENLLFQSNSIEKVIRGRLIKFVERLKKQPNEFHTFISGLCAMEEHKKSLIEHFSSGLTLFMKRNWTEAAQMFRKCLFIQPDDGPSLKYLKRIEEEQSLGSQDENWTGIWYGS